MTSAKIKMALFLHIFLSHLAFTGIVWASQLQEMEKPGRKQETFFSTFLSRILRRNLKECKFAAGRPHKLLLKSGIATSSFLDRDRFRY